MRVEPPELKNVPLFPSDELEVVVEDEAAEVVLDVLDMAIMAARVVW